MYTNIYQNTYTAVCDPIIELHKPNSIIFFEEYIYYKKLVKKNKL